MKKVLGEVSTKFDLIKVIQGGSSIVKEVIIKPEQDKIKKIQLNIGNDFSDNESSDDEMIDSALE